MEPYDRNCIDMRTAEPLLADSPQAQTVLARQLGEPAVQAVLEALRRREFTSDAGAMAYALLSDAIANESQTVWAGTFDADHDIYGIAIRRFGPVWWVSSVDYTDVGLFTSKDAALQFVYSNWEPVVPYIASGQEEMARPASGDNPARTG